MLCFRSDERAVFYRQVDDVTVVQSGLRLTFQATYGDKVTTVASDFKSLDSLNESKEQVLAALEAYMAGDDDRLILRF